MSLSSPLTKRLAIGAVVLAAAGGTGVVLMKKSAAPVTKKPSTSVAHVAAASASASSRPASAPNATILPPVPLDVTALTNKAGGKQSLKRRFPFVGGTDPRVAARINNQLFIETFEVLAPAHASDGLGEVTAETWQNRPEIDYKVQRNDGRIFSVVLATEGCGAYCESYNVSYAFDARSGRTLGAEDLLTPEGQAALTKEVKTANLAAIQAEITRLKTEKPKATGTKQQTDAEERAIALRMYEECALQRKAPDFINALQKMQIQPQTVVFSVERCSNHALSALDHVGDFSFRVAVDKLTPWLNDYGHHLLLGKAANFAMPTSAWGQVLRGQLDGKLPVTVRVGTPNADGSVSGVYFYDRFRKPLELSGTLKDHTLTLAETQSKDKQPPRMVLIPQGAGLQGTWEGATKMELTLEP